MRRKRSIDVTGLSHGGAPIPVAARVGPLLYSSGISGRELETGRLPETAGEQAQLAFSHMRAILAESGGSLDDVVRMNVHIADDGARAAINKEWLACFPDPADRPARHIAVQTLAGGALLQIEIIAYIARAGA